MSKYNEYAVKLDNAFNQAAGKCLKLYADVRHYEKALQNAKSMAETYRGERNTKVAMYKAHLEDAKEQLRTGYKAAWSEFDAISEALTQQLSQTIQGENKIDPADFDNSTISLLSSGIFGADDVAKLMEGYIQSENYTMQNVVAKYAEKAKEGKTGQELVRLMDIANYPAVRAGQIMSAWENLKSTALTCSGGYFGRKPETMDYNETMAAKWPELAGSAIAEF